MLTTMAAVLALLIAVPLAFVSALRPGTWIDVAIRAIAPGQPLDAGVLYRPRAADRARRGLHWFPVGGIGQGFLQDLYYLFLPALTLALSLSAVLLRNLRQSLLEVLEGEYVGFATAKGLPRRLVLGRHVLRNAWVSTVTLLGLNIGSLWAAPSSPRQCSPSLASAA